MTVQIVWHDDAIESGDHKAVPKSQLRKAKGRLLDNPECGKPLSRELTGARSIRVGGSENRLVYRIIRLSDDDIIVEILAVERRRDGGAYSDAAGRYTR